MPHCSSYAEPVDETRGRDDEARLRAAERTTLTLADKRSAVPGPGRVTAAAAAAVTCSSEQCTRIRCEALLIAPTEAGLTRVAAPRSLCTMQAFPRSLTDGRP